MTATAALAVMLASCAAPSDSVPTADPGRTSSPSSTSAPTPSADATRAPDHAPSASVPASPTPAATYRTPPATAAEGLERLKVKGRAPKTGYARAEFGTRWADTDHNGCDTRNDMLRRDLSGITVKPGTRRCKVATGTLVSPFTGEAIEFLAGANTSDRVQIDHVVALSDAWQKGAQTLTPEERQELANDPLNLLAVDGPSNNAKSDSDAASWLPPAVTFRCDYVATQIAVKLRYGLWVTPGEKSAMDRVLNKCEDQPLPGDRSAPPTSLNTPVHTEAPQPAPEPFPVPQPIEMPPAPTPVPAPIPDPGSGVYYQNCAAAREAAAAPLYAGMPGYRPQLDGDKDGVACEPRRG